MVKKKLRQLRKPFLRSCEVITGNIKRAGFLYFENKHSVVLLNTVTDEADLGPLKRFRRRHIEPEADVWIFPRKEVDKIILY
ncbi:MAG: hypothetical protein ABSF82_08255 [Candidatus Bathyarchaeia archaeon]|jgi:hypothetical protein